MRGVEAFAGVAQELALTQKQADGLVTWYASWLPKLGDPVQMEKARAAFAFEASRIGLTVDQARQLEVWYDALDAAPAEPPTTETLNTLHSLRAEWGASFGDKLASAKVAVRQLGGSDVVALLEETGLGNDARMIKLFARVGQMLDREKTGGADASTPIDTTTLSPAVAQRRIRELTDDPAGTYSGDGGAAMTGANGNAQAKRSGPQTKHGSALSRRDMPAVDQILTIVRETSDVDEADAKIARVADRFAEPFRSILYGMGLGCMLRKRQAHEATR